MIKYLLITVLSITSAWAQFTQFTGCDYAQTMNVGQVYDIFSPGYGSTTYFPGTNCRWRATAPVNSFIRLTCIDMRLPQNNCMDRIEMSWTGNYNDQSPTYACTGQTFTYTTGNALVIALRSQPTQGVQVTGYSGGMFRCQIVASYTNSATTVALFSPPIGVNIGK